MSTQRSFLSASLRLEGFVDICILMALSGTWLGLLGQWHWLLDLFSHFRWQYLIICLLAVAWTFWRKRRLMLCLSVASLLMNGWLIGSLGFRSSPAGVVEGQALHVICLNVLFDNPNKEGVMEYLRSSQADVIVLLEVTDAWSQALDELKDRYQHHLMRDQEDNFGVALFSRVPLHDLKLVQPPHSQMPSISARLKLDGRELVILGTHPVPPMSAHWAASRDAQLRDMAQYVADLKLPVLVMGDLNATPWCQGLRLLKEGARLDYRSPDPAWMPTWQVGTPFMLPIDHSLCTPELVIAHRQIGPDVGSDHRPQEIELRWAK